MQEENSNGQKILSKEEQAAAVAFDFKAALGLTPEAIEMLNSFAKFMGSQDEDDSPWVEEKVTMVFPNPDVMKTGVGDTWSILDSADGKFKIAPAKGLRGYVTSLRVQDMSAEKKKWLLTVRNGVETFIIKFTNRTTFAGTLFAALSKLTEDQLSRQMTLYCNPGSSSHGETLYCNVDVEGIGRIECDRLSDEEYGQAAKEVVSMVAAANGCKVPSTRQKQAIAPPPPKRAPQPQAQQPQAQPPQAQSRPPATAQAPPGPPQGMPIADYEDIPF